MVSRIGLIRSLHWRRCNLLRVYDCKWCCSMDCISQVVGIIFYESNVCVCKILGTRMLFSKFCTLSRLGVCCYISKSLLNLGIGTLVLLYMGFLVYCLVFSLAFLLSFRFAVTHYIWEHGQNRSSQTLYNLMRVRFKTLDKSVMTAFPL